MNNPYPYRTDAEQDALDFMPSSPYANDDQPYLSTARYSLVGYDPRELDKKALVDNQGTADNCYWHDKTREDNLAINIGQL